MDYFNYRENGQLFAEGCNLSELAAQHGTPPVEVPMAMMRSAVPAMARTVCVPGSPCAGAAHARAGVGALMPAPAGKWTAAPGASRHVHR